MDRSDVTLERMRSFVRVAERGSLSAVAREFETGQSTITRHLRELEAALGVSLIARTTRRIALTAEGARYYDQCIRILNLVEQAAQDVRDIRDAGAGTVRVSCTAALGVLHISRMIFDFQDLHPDIRIVFGLSDEQVDLVRDGVDIAIRLGPLTDSSMKLRALGESQRLLVASPAYLATHGKPAVPADLGLHEGIRMSRVAGSDVLTLRDAEGVQHVTGFRERLKLDHGLAMREALLAGRGFGLAHRWLVDDCLADGRLEQVLPGSVIPPVAFSMLVPPERASVARVRLLMDFLTRRVARIPGITA